MLEFNNEPPFTMHKNEEYEDGRVRENFFKTISQFQKMLIQLQMQFTLDLYIHPNSTQIQI